MVRQNVFPRRVALNMAVLPFHGPCNLVFNHQHHVSTNTTMTANFREIIEANPIGDGLDAFQASVDSICAARNIPSTLNTFDHFTQEGKDTGIIIFIFNLTILQISKISHLTYCLLCETVRYLESYHRTQVVEPSNMISVN